MNEKNNIQGQKSQKRKICLFTRISFYCAVCAWIVVVLVVAVGVAFEITTDSGLAYDVLNYFLLLIPISILLALLFAVIGIIHIIIKRKTIRGWGRIIGSFFILSPFLICAVFLPWLQYRKNPPIHMAADDGDIATVKSLLAKKPKLVNSKSIYSDTPLHRAAANGHKEIVELLIANGADVNFKDNVKKTPLLDALNYKCNKDVVELLLANGADLNVQDIWDHTPLIKATRYCSKDIVELLIAYGANVNTKNDKGETALDIAEKEGKQEIVDLLRKHSSVDKQDLKTR
jgi:hypothetical protein